MFNTKMGKRKSGEQNKRKKHAEDKRRKQKTHAHTYWDRKRISSEYTVTIKQLCWFLCEWLQALSAFGSNQWFQMKLLFK